MWVKGNNGREIEDTGKGRRHKRAGRRPVTRRQCRQGGTNRRKRRGGKPVPGGSKRRIRALGDEAGEVEWSGGWER